ncbi:hypothetical protein HBNCFIEN_02964 [Legionella sp. PC997]|nr:hypothetical protein HBNCFIEN_02964 [Legionella sp. PC997]
MKTNLEFMFFVAIKITFSSFYPRYDRYAQGMG